MTSIERDEYTNLTVDDLQLICRARSVDVSAGATRDEIVMLLCAQDARAAAPLTSESTPKPAPEKKRTRTLRQTRPTVSVEREPTGWWSSMSVTALRAVAREHGVDVAAGMHRVELVRLLVDHDVPRPTGQTSGRRRPSR